MKRVDNLQKYAVDSCCQRAVQLIELVNNSNEPIFKPHNVNSSIDDHDIELVTSNAIKVLESLKKSLDQLTAMLSISENRLKANNLKDKDRQSFVEKLAAYQELIIRTKSSIAVQQSIADRLYLEHLSRQVKDSTKEEIFALKETWEKRSNLASLASDSAQEALAKTALIICTRALES